MLHAAEIVRKHTLERHGDDVFCRLATHLLALASSPSPFTVNFQNRYARPLFTQSRMPSWIGGFARLAIPLADVEVSATHIGMVLSPLLYSALARKLAEK